MKRLFFLLALTLIFFNVNFASALEVNDVNADYWAAPEIANVVNKGYMKLDSNTNFKPEGSLTRAEFVHSLLKVIRSQDIKPVTLKTKFKDVDRKTQYDDSILTSEQLKYIFGYPDYTFKPKQPILRSETTAVVANVTKGFYGDIDVLNGFQDKDKIPNWALYSYIKNTVHKLLVNHPDKTMLRPGDKLTRAEAAVLFSTIEKRLDLIESRFKRDAMKIPSELLGVEHLSLVEGAPRNTVNIYNTKYIIEAGNVILLKPEQRVDTKAINEGDQLVFNAPSDVYTQEGTLLYPQGTKFIADVQKVKKTPFRHKNAKDLIVVRKLVLPSGLSHQMAGVAYTTNKGKIVTTKNLKKNPIKENYFEGRKEITKAEFLVKYTDKLSPEVKYKLKVDDVVLVLLTGDMVIPNERYWEFELQDLDL